MKGKRLGRGLEEVSHVFLSSETAQALTDAPRERSPVNFAAQKEPVPDIHTIGITGHLRQPVALFTLCNLSIELARQGYRVLVIDDDPGGVNVTHLMGLMDVESHAEMNFTNAPMGVRIAYRTSFLNDLISRDDYDPGSHRFFWPEKYRHFDFILFYLPAGRFGEMGPLLRRISLAIVMTSTDHKGMLEAYGTIKDLHQRARQVNTGLTVYSEKEGVDPSETFYRMARNVRKFLKRDLVSYSYILRDEGIDESIKEGFPLVLKWPSSEVRRNIYNISGLFIEDHAQRACLKKDKD